MELIEHIGIFDNMMSPELCDAYINFFEEVLQNKESWFGGSINDFPHNYPKIQDGEEQFANKKQLGRKDTGIYLNFLNSNLSAECYAVLQECFNLYSDYYTGLKEFNLNSLEIKMQKTPPGGGYHVWHCERLEYQHTPRQLTWMIYLNDLPEGEGETEFIYQKLRILPKAGTVVLWPAAYTHMHRGNTVFSKDKYILTGWFCSVPTI